MAEATLAGCLAAFALYHFWSAREWNQEREHLVHTIIARTPGEVVMLDRTPTRKKPPTPVGDEFDGYSGVLAVDQ